MNVTSVGNPICRLAECPIWNDTENVLYWTDIPAGSLWRYDPHGGNIRQEWEGDLVIGGFAFTPGNDIILCTHKGVYKLERPAGRLQLLFQIPMAKDERFNDITTDPRGRILAGTLTERRTDGILYRLERDREPAVLLRDLHTSNGMTFSLDLKYFYHTDSHVRTITRYEYDLDSGDISHPSVFYRGADEDGSPDGITMDSEGYIWVGCYRAGKVLRLDGCGRIVQTTPVPAPQSSSVMFGGDDLGTLFITSGAQGAADPTTGRDRDGRYLGGAVFRVRPGVTGRKEWRADW